MLRLLSPIAIVLGGGCATVNTANRFERFHARQSGQLTFEATSVVLSYPNGRFYPYGQTPNSQFLYLRTEVLIHNGTAEPVQVCRDPSRSRIRRYRIPDCVRVAIEHGEWRACDGLTSLPDQHLQPGEGARFDVCSVVDQAPATTVVRASRVHRFVDRSDLGPADYQPEETVFAGSGPLPVVSLPGLPVAPNLYPRNMQGNLDLRPESVVTGDFHHPADDEGKAWILSMYIALQNRSNLTLVVDTGAFRGILDPPAQIPGSQYECSKLPRVLEPYHSPLLTEKSLLITLAPGQGWRPQSWRTGAFTRLRSGSSCTYPTAARRGGFRSSDVERSRSAAVGTCGERGKRDPSPLSWTIAPCSLCSRVSHKQRRVDRLAAFSGGLRPPAARSLELPGALSSEPGAD
ncbi:MAG: hypothetical protein MUF64_30750 [Polyangiaceae bacterium]|nr:hypothetical protein [Polyangiaceae bacterium]